MTSVEKAKKTYNFHKSVTSNTQSVGNVAEMEALMNEMRNMENEDSRSGSVVIKTDDEYDSDELEKVCFVDMVSLTEEKLFVSQHVNR